MVNKLKRLFPEKWKRKVKDDLGVPSLHRTLQHLKSVDFTPDHVVDGGAYEGQWALDFLEVFPATKILMIEAQESKKDKLDDLCSQNASLKFYIGLLSGENDKTFSFMENETASHIEDMPTISGEYTVRELKTITLDKLMEQTNFGPVNFLKLDVQGHESEVLRGSKVALASAEFCLLEVTLLELGENSVLFIDLANQMADFGFQIYDITQLMRRPFDNALYQMDVLFVRKNSKFISDKRW